MRKKITSIILCVVMIFSVAATPVGAISLTPSRGIVSSIKNGYPMADLGAILKGIYQINVFVNKLTGIPIFNDERLVMTVDETIQTVLDEIYSTKGVNFGAIADYLPAINRYPELITSTFKVNIPELQRLMLETADNCYNNGQPVLSGIISLLRVWLGVVDTCHIKLIPIDGRPGVYKFAAEIGYRDGRSETFVSDIVYDENKNELVKEDGSPALLGFSVDLEQMVSYTGINVWQRNFGFCMGYDLFCFFTPYLMNYVTQRIKFNYDHREWMIQIWKGTYFITNGGEVGVYNRPWIHTGSFYFCAKDEDMLKISLEIYHKDDLLLKRGPMMHWWVTGFSVDSVCYAPQTLTLVTTITMKDEEMLKAFTRALKLKWYALSYETDGLDVTITW